MEVKSMKVRSNISKVFVFLLLLTSCDNIHYLKSLKITKLPEKLVYISGIDTEIDYSGGIVELHSQNPKNSVYEDQAISTFVSDYPEAVEAYVNFDSTGVEVISIRVAGEEVDDSNRFPIQIIDQAFIDRIVECKSRGICE
jgi:hypothetical protein